jgi:diacylglycerol kinase (ATP)
VTDPTPSAPRLAAVVYNPTKVDLGRVKKAVAAAEVDGWLETLWFATTVADAGVSQTREAISAGATVVIAAGGDGTVRAVAEGLRGSDTSLAILPSGTGNVLARNLNLTHARPEETIGWAFSGRERQIDIGMVEIVRADGKRDEHAFVVLAGLGFDARMIALTNPRLKRAFGWLAYVDAGVRAIPELKSVKLRYSLDGAPERSSSVHTIFIGNCGAMPGGILLLPDAEPDDGLLDIAAIRPAGLFGWIKVWNRLTWQNGVLLRSALGRSIIGFTAGNEVRYVTAKDLRMTVEVPQAVQLDGDEFGEAVTVHAWIEPLALTVMVPERG